MWSNSSSKFEVVIVFINLSNQSLHLNQVSLKVLFITMIFFFSLLETPVVWLCELLAPYVIGTGECASFELFTGNYGAIERVKCLAKHALVFRFKADHIILFIFFFFFRCERVSVLALMSEDWPVSRLFLLPLKYLLNVAFEEFA